MLQKSDLGSSKSSSSLFHFYPHSLESDSKLKYYSNNLLVYCCSVKGFWLNVHYHFFHIPTNIDHDFMDALNKMTHLKLSESYSKSLTYVGKWYKHCTQKCKSPIYLFFFSFEGEWQNNKL